MRVLRTVALLALSAGCGRAIQPIVTPGTAAVALTAGPNTSMIYLARTSSGVIAIDLGWSGKGRALTHALEQLGATAADVSSVFLTHSHRDHVAAWPVLRHARFFLAAAEVPRLLGQSAHEGWLPRVADELKPPNLPKPDELPIRPFTTDTTIVVGADTLRAYLVPGHTSGAAVYLFRGVLFVGDAVSYSRFGGFRATRAAVSDDRKVAAENLEKLWSRLPVGGVRYVCTAHARCATFAEFMADLR